MSPDRIGDALAAASDTRDVRIGAGELGAAAEMFERSFGDSPAVLVGDENTIAVAGRGVREALVANGRDVMDPFVYPGEPVLYADYENVRPLAESLRGHGAVPVAVGSGTVNDLVKRASFESERPYMTVATAASMDGYASFGASITKEGFKHTMECPAPRAVLADLDILVAAPPGMTASGYGDLLAKIPAGADWLIADALEVEPIDPRAWTLVQEPLREATGRPQALQAADAGAMEGLIEGLVMSGLAMQAASSSRPASGAEHQFSHLWEMEGLGQHPPAGQVPLSHGFKVALGTVSISALYERLLACDLAAVDVEAVAGSWPSWEQVQRSVRDAFASDRLAEPVVAQSQAKYVDAQELARRLALLVERWPELRERLREQLLPARQVRAQLREAGCPTTPAEIGLSMQALRCTYRRAQLIRQRYTILDLLNETGLLDKCVDELFAPGGFWASG
jgi:glycerol-1-phosphate dehydrogenase [NAD(P)+]